MFLIIRYTCLVYTYADSNPVHFSGVDDSQNVFSIFNISRIQSDFCGAGLDSFDGPVRAEPRG